MAFIESGHDRRIVLFLVILKGINLVDATFRIKERNFCTQQIYENYIVPLINAVYIDRDLELGSIASIQKPIGNKEMVQVVNTIMVTKDANYNYLWLQKFIEIKKYNLKAKMDDLIMEILLQDLHRSAKLEVEELAAASPHSEVQSQLLQEIKLTDSFS